MRAEDDDASRRHRAGDHKIVAGGAPNRGRGLASEIVVFPKRSFDVGFAKKQVILAAVNGVRMQPLSLEAVQTPKYILLFAVLTFLLYSYEF